MGEESTSGHKSRVAAARARETRFLMSLNLHKMNRWLLALLSVFIALNFLDVFTTLIAIQAGPTFVEHNPIAAGLFRLNFPGFVAALALKYVPVLPLTYATLLPTKDDGKLGLRIVKMGTLVALGAADLFYVAVVGSNSLNLYSYFY